jgi:hypothetical protein
MLSSYRVAGALSKFLKKEYRFQTGHLMQNTCGLRVYSEDMHTGEISQRHVPGIGWGKADK